MHLYWVGTLIQILISAFECPPLVDRIILLVPVDSAGLASSPGGTDYQVQTSEPDGAWHSVRRVAGRKVWWIMSQNQVC